MTTLPASAAHPVNLALQGGGSHGAFTWGVLDTLLADPRIAIEGISGASAGAVNAVALASGWAKALAANADPRQGARDSLRHLWEEVVALGRVDSLSKNLANIIWGGIPKEFAPTNFLSSMVGSWFSPYQANPLDINPLRDLLQREIDFAAVAALKEPRVFVSATEVRTGKAALFTGPQLTPQAVMASACLPMLFQAVEIDGEPYWDGGYSANPAVMPLVDHCTSADIVLVQINPVVREHKPQTPGDIMDRVNELTFNASLMTQMREIDFINRLLAQGLLQGNRCRSVLLHRIDGGSTIQGFPGSSRATADAGMVRTLFELGQESARLWLKEHYQHLGQRSTVDIRRDYLDDTRIDSVKRSPEETPVPRRGLQSLISRLFSRKKR